MRIQAILCVNTSSQTHAEEATIKEHYFGSDMTNSLCCSKCGEYCTRCGIISLPLVEHKFSLNSRHEPEPYVRTTATNDDHDATAETPTAITAPGADDNNDPDDEHEYVNAETDNIIE